MNILIVGAGAIGCMLAARLAQAGQTITLAARPHTSAKIRAQGVHLVEADGRETAPTIEIADGIAGALAGGQAFDLIILAVKAYHTEEAATALAQAMPMPVLTVQNGVGNEEALAERLPEAPIMAGALTTPVEVLGPGHVQIARPSFRFAVAPGPNGGEIAPVAEIFQTAGFTAQTVGDYRALKWSKLLMNILANAQSAILGYTPAELFAQPELGNLEVLAWREAMTVMKYLGIKSIALGGYPLNFAGPLVTNLPLSLVRPILGRFIAGGRGSKMPSLYYDFHPTVRTHSEILWLNGAVAKAGQKHGIATPVNAAFTMTLTEMMAGNSAPEEWAGRPDRFLDAVHVGVR